jgi:hypothetical protein
MRPLTARLVVTGAFAALSALGCANRGMVAPSLSGTGGTGAVTGAGGTGHGGGGGSGVHDASCSPGTDAQGDHSLTGCNALFNFETGTEGATLGPSTAQGAFTKVTQSGTQVYCGSGALAINAAFSGSSGLTVLGEVDLPLATDAGGMNLAGKTLTVHALAIPGCDATVRLSAELVTASTAPVVALRIAPLTSSWSTQSVTLPADAGVTDVIKLAIDVTSTDAYQGTIYIDEIDIN